MNLINNFFFRVAALILILESFSLLGYFFPFLMPLFYILILILAVFLVWQDINNAVYLLLGELILGGQGYLLHIGADSFNLSLRLGLFVVCFLVWAVKTLITKDFSFLKRKEFLLVSVFGLFFSLSVLIGLFSGRPLSNIFLDLNGYLYFGLIGLFLSAKINFKKAGVVALFATAFIALESLFLVFAFAHGLSWVGNSWLYGWIRSTGVGEIAKISEPLYRVFFQSHIFNLYLVFPLLAILFLVKHNLSKWQIGALLFFLWLNILALYISQSRSFWLSGAVMIVPLVIFIIYELRKQNLKVFLVIMIIPVLILFSDLVVKMATGDFKGNLWQQRMGEGSEQAGVSSRSAQIWPLLNEIKKAPLFGQGFAKEVTYVSNDPRVRLKNPTGEYTTYAFELGYFDMALKYGLLGLGAYLSLLFYLLFKLYKKSKGKPIYLGLALSLLALMIVNIFTPYLNHPLGIGFILILIALI